MIHGGLKELYDLVKDPEETNNIINIDRALAENMRMKLREIRKRVVVGARIWHLQKRLRKNLL